MSFLDTLLGRKHPPMIGLDISSSSVKLVELGQTRRRRVRARALRHRAASRRAGSPTARSRSSTRSPRPCAAWSRRAAPRTRNVAMAMPQSAVITKKIMLPAGLREEELEVQVETEANQYIPFSLDEVSLDFCVIGPEPDLGRRRRGADRRLAQGPRAGPPGPGRGRRPEAGGARHRIARLAPGDEPRRSQALPNEGKDALVALFEIGADTTSLQGAARRRDALRPRPGLRRLAADAADLAPVRLLVRGGRAEEARRRPARGLRDRRCSRPSSTACRRKSAARCSTSSPARRTTRCTT